MPVIIAGFSPNDKVPGFYGQVQYGTAGQSAAGLPIALLLVGLATSAGTITPDQQVVQIYQDTDLDTYAGIGSELATMGYDALAEQTDIPIFIASPKPAGGGVAATTGLTITGTATSAGTIGVRIGGYLVTTQVNNGDLASAVCTNIAANINGANEGRLPIVAVAGATFVTLNCATPGVRGNQHVIFLVTTLGMPTGLAVTNLGVTWASGQVVTLNSYTQPTVPNGFYYKVTTAGTGTTGTTQPTWPTTVGTASSADSNGVIWTCWGVVTNGNGTFLGGGSGLETYTNLLNTLSTQGFGRIAIACNDATSVLAWKNNIDTDAGAMIGYLQHVCTALNTTQSAATTLASGASMNDQRFQCLFLQSSETHPSRMAASNMANRAFEEVSDPNKNYDGYVLSTVAPQSQILDVPLHSQQVAMLNLGVTPLTTIGQATVEIVRGITTKCLTNNQPDYSTLDVGFAVVPDFVLTQLRFVWITFQQSNERVRGPLASGEKQPPTGVAYPDLWNSTIEAQLMGMEAGEIPGTCPPILQLVEQNLPTTNLDPTAVGRLMSAVPVDVMPDLHQVGLSVQQI